MSVLSYLSEIKYEQEDKRRVKDILTNKQKTEELQKDTQTKIAQITDLSRRKKSSWSL